jgi:phage gp45-like
LKRNKGENGLYRIQEPCADEASESGAYARSAADTVPSDPSRRNEPSNKVIYTKYGKEIKLTPNSVEITSGTGHKICLYDNGGVTIDSAKSVSVNASGDILIESGTKINVSGNEIEFSQGSGSFNMSGGVITEDGQEVKIGE